MKKLITLLIALFFAVPIIAQDSTATVNNYYKGNLTASRDSVKIAFTAFGQNNKYATVIAWHTTSADTIYVDTQVRNLTNGSWTNKLLYNLSDGTTHAYIVTTTTKVEYAIIDPEPFAIRLRTADVTVSTSYIAQAKNGMLSAVFTGLPTGGATLAEQQTQTTRLTSIRDYVDLVETKLDSADATLSRTETKMSDGLQTSRAVSYSSGGYGTFSVSTVDTLSGTSVACSEVEITNNTAGATLYVGFNGSTSTSNGLPLGYRDSYRVKITNLNKIYLVGSTTVDVRYVYTNY